MNDTLAFTTGIFIGCIIIFILVMLCRCNHDRSGLSGTDGNNGSARDLEQRAAADNRRLADEERRTADTVREQAEDIGRAERNNQSARDLIQKGKEILNRYNDNK